ncbi:hypothetical protein RFI_23790 [Reticulomyxa filosa]|uniref:Nucleolar GTP-binding protein 2 N-terminal domain-containing protein n=1 Tax=Reticulomyxa filosa TaxID=46433 RepID=X6MI81_RETFI|nr:hypothetical protein RFI_23790 [Reticulomyxa filosa]|eukprot:ETO13579.1 hypothetical protein RFI_23790 [Reticulomyxa filosa]
MGKGRNKQLLTNRMKRITKEKLGLCLLTTKGHILDENCETNREVVKPKGKFKDYGKITDAKRVVPKGTSHLRDRGTIKRLKMYDEKPLRTRKGEIVKQKFMSRTCENPVSRIHPDRRWFGNSKVVSQKQLQIFRDQITKQVKDPYTIVLKHKKIPYGLLNLDTNKVNRMNLLQVESFNQTFGPGSQRKKPKLKASNLENLATKATQATNEFEEEASAIPKDIEHEKSFEASEKEQLEPIFLSGQSQRIKNELYKVIDSSDVILQVLDARDPMGTRSPHIEKYLKLQCPHKHLS